MAIHINLNPLDCSPHLHQLLRVFAEERVAAEGRAAGVVTGPGALGKIMGKVRRAMAVTVVRAQQVGLLSWLQELGQQQREGRPL